MKVKKNIASWLIRIARRLDRDRNINEVEHYEPKMLGVGYHISKKDVVKYRKEHPEYKSHREGLKALIDDTKQIILGNIAAGISDKGLIEYGVSKTFWTADVTGTLNVYVPAIKTECVTDGREETKE